MVNVLLNLWWSWVFEVEDNDVEETQVVKKLTAGFFLGIILVILTENTYAVPLQ